MHKVQMYKGLQRKVMGILGMEKWTDVLFELLSRDLQARLVDSGSKVRLAAGGAI